MTKELQQICSMLMLLALPLISCTSPNDPYNSGSGSTGGGSSYKQVKAAFEYKVQQPMTVVLTNRSENAASYRWSFGDGESSSEANPIHRYKSKGVYEITLTATNKKGQQSAYATVKVEEPSNIYITGFTIGKIPYENQYYRVQVIDDDFFTTTWVQTGYKLLSSAILPFTGNLTSPVLMDGIADDDYYVMQLWYNTKSSGTGTKVAAYKITKAQILQYPDKVTGSGDNVSLTCHFGYK